MIAKEPEVIAKRHTLDKSLFKGKDLELVLKVTRFLEDRGLQYRIVGSVVDNAARGLPRTYRDINIVVERSYAPGENSFAPTGPRSRTIYDLFALGGGHRIYDRDSFLEEVNTGEEGICLENLPGNTIYAPVLVDNRFKFRKGSTIVDLCFEGTGLNAGDDQNSEHKVGRELSIMEELVFVLGSKDYLKDHVRKPFEDEPTPANLGAMWEDLDDYEPYPNPEDEK